MNLNPDHQDIIMGALTYLANHNGANYHFPVNRSITYLIRDLAPDGEPNCVPGTTRNPAGLRFEVYVLSGENPRLGNHALRLFRGAYADSEAAFALIAQIVGRVETLPPSRW